MKSLVAAGRELTPAAAAAVLWTWLTAGAKAMAEGSGGKGRDGGGKDGGGELHCYTLCIDGQYL